MSDKSKIVRVFFPGREAGSISSLGSGKINETLLVEFVNGEPLKTVLQKVNKKVFPEPENIMANIRFLSDHLTKTITLDQLMPKDQWHVVSPYLTPEGFDYTIDRSGNYWRMLSYIDDAVSFEHVSSKEQACEVGRALGKFHRLTSGLAPECFFDTLPGFHVTPEYLDKYDSVIGEHSPGLKSEDEKWCGEFVEKHRDGADLLEEAWKNGRIKKRVIHGDPKVSNVMFDKQTGKAVSIVDLDTVKPGLLHYDLGDCFRSSCNPAGGSGDDIDNVRFDIETFETVLKGYFEEMGDYLAEADYDLIGSATFLITFELGLRYFTDHLLGDVYFKSNIKGQNLKRCIGQFVLADDIRKKSSEIRDVVHSLSSKN